MCGFEKKIIDVRTLNFLLGVEDILIIFVRSRQLLYFTDLDTFVFACGFRATASAQFIGVCTDYLVLDTKYAGRQYY